MLIYCQWNQRSFLLQSWHNLMFLTHEVLSIDQYSSALNQPLCRKGHSIPKGCARCFFLICNEWCGGEETTKCRGMCSTFHSTAPVTGLYNCTTIGITWHVCHIIIKKLANQSPVAWHVLHFSYYRARHRSGGEATWHKTNQRNTQTDWR